MTNQKLLADAYSKAFQLNSSEVACLRSNVVTPEFFTALRKTQTISNNCRVLMQGGHQTSALSLMEQISTHQVYKIKTYDSQLELVHLHFVANGNGSIV